MDKVIDIIEKLPLIVAAASGVLTALMGLFMLIPGDQPERSLQKIVDFLARFSRKKG